MPMIDPGIEAYAERHTTSPTRELASLMARAKTELPYPPMVSGRVVGRLLETLVFALQAKLVLEIGTYAGTTTVWLAQALAPGGRVITCDIDPESPAHAGAAWVTDRETAAFATAAWSSIPEGDRIKRRLGLALETLATLDGPFDLVFIDADKEGYTDYLDAVLPKLSSNGVVVIDNTLSGGSVLNSDTFGGGASATARFNDRVANDPALVATFLTVDDGVTLVRKA